MTRQGRPVGLIITAVAVLAVGLLLLFIMKSGDDDASAGAPRPAPGSSGGAAIGRDRPRPSLDLPGAPQVVSAERTSATTAGSDGDPGYTETVINGVRVRDHRKDRSAPIQLGSGRRPPDGRKIQPSLTADISNRILPIVRQCGASVPAEARGGKPRVEGEVVIAIRNQQVQITRASVRLTDVVGDFAESAKQCIDQKTLGLTVPAGDEADLEDYTITLSYGLF